LGDEDLKKMCSLDTNALFSSKSNKGDKRGTIKGISWPVYYGIVFFSDKKEYFLKMKKL
jgi:hypothetical protein